MDQVKIPPLDVRMFVESQIDPIDKNYQLVMIMHSNGDVQTLWKIDENTLTDIFHMVLLHTLIATEMEQAKMDNKPLPNQEDLLVAFRNNKSERLSLGELMTGHCIKRICKKLKID